MNKKYSVIDDKILRGQDVVATINGDELDFLEGKAKYRIHAVRTFNAYKEKLEPIETVVPQTKKSEPKKVTPKKKGPKGWLEVVSEIVGEELPDPDKTTGYHRTKYRDVLMKHRNDICSSKELTPQTKQNIMKLFI